MKILFRAKCTKRKFGHLRKLMQLRKAIQEEARKRLLESKLIQEASDYLREPELNLYGKQAYLYIRNQAKEGFD